MLKDLGREKRLLTVDSVKARVKSAGFFMSSQATGSAFFCYMRSLYWIGLLPIIYLNPSIFKGLGYINLSSLMPHIAPFRGSYEAFSF